MEHQTGTKKLKNWKKNSCPSLNGHSSHNFYPTECCKSLHRTSHYAWLNGEKQNFWKLFFPGFFSTWNLLFFTPQQPVGISEFRHWNIHPTAWGVKQSLGHFLSISTLKGKKLAKKSFFGLKMAPQNPNFFISPFIS